MTASKKEQATKSSCCAPNESCTPSVNRRQLLKGLGAGMASASGLFSMPIMAGPFSDKTLGSA